VEVFERARAAGLPQVVVSMFELEQMIEQARLGLSAASLLDAPAPAAAGHARPALHGAYVAPTTETERVLAGLWAQMLGVERVGVHATLFELGGDSVVGIRLIARANQAGLRFTVKQLFERPTIAELAGAVLASVASAAEQGPVTGPVALTPIQQRFFERAL